MKNKIIYCNGCGKKIKSEKGILQEGVLSVEQTWGYFSEKDGEQHTFHLCETCYDKLTAWFERPVSIKKQKELL